MADYTDFTRVRSSCVCPSFTPVFTRSGDDNHETTSGTHIRRVICFRVLENVQHPLRVRHGHRRRDVFELERRCPCRLTCGGRRREPRSALPASSATRAPPPPWHARPARGSASVRRGSSAPSHSTARAPYRTGMTQQRERAL